MAWIPVVAAGVLLVSLLTGLSIAAVLGRISARLSELDQEFWAAMPLSASSSDN